MRHPERHHAVPERPAADTDEALAEWTWPIEQANKLQWRLMAEAGCTDDRSCVDWIDHYSGYLRETCLNGAAGKRLLELYTHDEERAVREIKDRLAKIRH